MKYQSLAYLGIAALGAVSASPVIQHEVNSVCPSGYTQSVYYVTVTPSFTPTSAAVVEPTTTLESSSTVTESVVITPEVPVESPTSTAVETPAPVETTPVVFETPAPGETTSATPEISPMETSAPAEPTTTSSSSTEKPMVIPTAATTSTTAEVESTPVVVEPTSSSSTKEYVETTKPSTTAEVQSTTAAAPTTSESEQTTTSIAPAASATTYNRSATSSSSTGSTNAGSATFYGGNVGGGACSFSGYTLPSNLFGTALGSPRWDNAAECGACVSVTGPNGNSVKAMIVDKCPECDSNHLDLFQNAFAELADISKGVIDINWSYVSCDISSPLILKNKEGTSQYWFSMQIVNANEAVASLEVSTDGGSTWQKTTRSDYNFFENTSGFGTEKVDVRVTGKSGKVVRVNSVGVTGGSSVTASGNI
ncbi:hypothetical protein BBP40_001810 [Aspergillus hancockii]|nr:hypothetical protein BBP40_001810 [Aspergillus hancockii]